jgi:integrase
VLTVRNFLDDLALWGWTERPTRQLVFASDVPRLPRALPRALSPDQDRALMAAVAALVDPFARCGLLVLRGVGLRLGELLDLELDSVVDYGPAGSWLRVPLGKLGAERSLPLDPDTLVALDAWATHRGSQRALPHPATADPPTSCSASTAGSCDPGASARGSTRPCTPPGSPARMGRRCGWCPTSCATPTARCWSTPG